MMTDPIADMLTRIRNAQMIRAEYILIPFSKLKMNLANLLLKEGYLQSVEKIDNIGKPAIKIGLKYINRESAIHCIKRISKPGRRVYSQNKSLPFVLNNLGIAIISTSQGLMTNKEARKKKCGGEIICEIY